MNIKNEIETAIQTEDLAGFVREYVSNGNLSIRGMAALVDVAHTSLIRGGALASQKLAKKLEAHGFEGGALAANGFPPEAVWLVVEHHAYESPKARTLCAIAIARTFGAYGVKAAFRDAVKDAQPHTQPVMDSDDLRAFKALVAKAQALEDAPAGPVRDALERALVLEIEPKAVGPLRSAQKRAQPPLIPDEEVLLNLLNAKGPMTLREVVKSSCLQRRGVTRTANYRDRLEALIETGKVVRTGNRFHIC